MVDFNGKDGPLSFIHSGVEMEADKHDLDFEESLDKMSDEDLVTELRYWTVYERRILQLQNELEMRKNNKDKTDGKD